jgi:hypothetical protein
LVALSCVAPYAINPPPQGDLHRLVVAEAEPEMSAAGPNEHFVAA